MLNYPPQKIKIPTFTSEMFTISLHKKGAAFGGNTAFWRRAGAETAKGSGCGRMRTALP